MKKTKVVILGFPDASMEDMNYLVQLLTDRFKDTEYEFIITNSGTMTSFSKKELMECLK